MSHHKHLGPKNLSLISMLLLLCFMPRNLVAQDDFINRYPKLDQYEWGHLERQFFLAQKSLDDFSDYHARNQDDLTSYRYSIAFSAYFLAAVHYFKLPAWPESIKNTFHYLIDKMQQKAVWSYWSRTSKGVPALEPHMNRPYPEQRDPVAQKNIMYSGHLMHMIALYEMLFHDYSYGAKNSLRFHWDAYETYSYSFPELALLLFNQMEKNEHHGISCEPNAVFPECNQHPILGFKLFDVMHHTNYASANEHFFDFFKRAELIDPASHETAMLFLEKQNTTLSDAKPYYYNLNDIVVTPAVKSGLISLASASANGWTGLFMHAWKPEYIEQQYRYWKENHLIVNDNGMQLKGEVWEPMVAYGFFASLAAELGDDSVKNALLFYASKFYSPKWKDSSYYFPYDLRKGCIDLTDRLLALARVLPKNGMWLMHNKPFSPTQKQQPYISNVDIRKVSVSRAIFDAKINTLIVSLLPKGVRPSKTGLRINQLGRDTIWRIAINDKELGLIKNKENVFLNIDIESSPLNIIIEKLEDVHTE